MPMMSPKSNVIPFPARREPSREVEANTIDFARWRGGVTFPPDEETITIAHTFAPTLPVSPYLNLTPRSEAAVRAERERLQEAARPRVEKVRGLLDILLDPFRRFAGGTQ